MILEIIQSVIGDLVRTSHIKDNYIDKNHPWLGILAAAVFVIWSATNKLKFYNLGELIFGRDMIILVKHMVGWELICQKKQTQINKDNNFQNSQRVYYDYKFG